MEKNDSSQEGASANPVGGVEIPKGSLARDARKTAKTLLPGVLSRHAQRVFVFAVLAGRHNGLMFDHELLYVAAMFMNVGLTSAYANSERRYEVDSASAIREFLESHGAPADVALDAWYAVALHTTSEIPDHASPLAGSLAAGVRTDLFGDKAGIIPPEAKTAILKAFPRGERFKERFIEAVSNGVAHRPASTFGAASADVLERVDPDYWRLNYCGLILGAPWKD